MINLCANKTFFKRIAVTPQTIGCSLFQRLPLTKNETTYLSKGLQDLHLIDIDCTRYSQSTFLVEIQSIIDTENYDIDKQDFYVDVDIEELQKIYSLHDSDKYRLARFYASLCSLIAGKDKDKKIGQWDLNTISLKSHLSIPTIRDYFKKLKQLELIDFSDILYVNENGHFSPIPFSKWSDRETLHKQIEYIKKKNNIIHRKEYGNSRSLWQKYYWLKQGKQYPEKEAEQIYRYVQDKYNQACREMKECEVGSYRYNRSLKTLESIDFDYFEQYNFYI